METRGKGFILISRRQAGPTHPPLSLQDIEKIKEETGPVEGRRNIKVYMQNLHLECINANKYLLRFMYKKLLPEVLKIENRIERVFLATFIAKFYQRLLTLEFLCLDGHQEDMRTAYRTLLEDFITFMFIYRDVPKYFTLFAGYKDILHKQMVEATDKFFSPADPFPPEQREKIVNNYEKSKALYPNEYRWSDYSLRKMAKEVGLQEYWYDILYRLASSHTHTTAFSMDQFVRPPRFIGPARVAETYMFGPQVFQAHDMLANSHVACLTICHKALEKIDLGKLKRDLDKISKVTLKNIDQEIEEKVLKSAKITVPFIYLTNDGRFIFNT